MRAETIYQTLYAGSRAFIVGINEYAHQPALGCARQDAEAVRDVLIGRYAFPAHNVTVLLDEEATREQIMSSFLRYCGNGVDPDDRIVFYFAGHGMTVTGRSREVGYLVPVDGRDDELSTLIRWDDLTRNADLIPAKHMLFLMDACYGGLALTRSGTMGNKRFLNDMLTRYSRQVLTAGKPDELVADSGGPRLGHSVFTGHLLDALERDALSTGEVLSASAVMAYVYNHVAADPHSSQTPHYGFLEGDGDFIFSMPEPKSNGTAEPMGNDFLATTGTTLANVVRYDEQFDYIDMAKQFISNRDRRIDLEDLVNVEIRRAAVGIGEISHSLTDGPMDIESVLTRIRAYERAIERLQDIVILLARWGDVEQLQACQKIVSHLGNANQLASGLVSWLGLRWYPLSTLLYSIGIGALVGRNWEAISLAHDTRLSSRVSNNGRVTALVATVSGISEASDCFKRIPGNEKKFVPYSEYVFRTVQQRIEERLFLGDEYEEFFDRYEIFRALLYIDATVGEDLDGHLWGPPGRFAWKHRRNLGKSLFDEVAAEASLHGSSWPPLMAGMFSGSLERFQEIAKRYRDFLGRLSWY